MRHQLLCFLLLIRAVPLTAQDTPQAPPPPPPLPQVVSDILTLPALPSVLVSPDRTSMLVVEQRAPATEADLGPVLELAGLRINPRTNGPHVSTRIAGLMVKRIEDGVEVRLTLPPNSEIDYVRWSPDGKKIVFTQATDAGLVLWLADPLTGQARVLTKTPLNATSGAPCRWMAGSLQLLCSFIPEGRSAAPATPSNPGAAAGVDPSAAPDGPLFEHYFTAQLAFVDAANGNRTPIGRPAIFEQVEPSPSGLYLLVSRIVRPYAQRAPVDLNPKELEIWDLRGSVVRALATLQRVDSIPPNGVRTGPRSASWHHGLPATVVWVEALDGGDPRNRADHRDRTLTLAEVKRERPFRTPPLELARLQYRFASIIWDRTGMGVLTEEDRERRVTRSWLVHPGNDRNLTFRRMLWTRSMEERYEEPGLPATHLSTTSGDKLLVRDGDWVYFTGAAGSATGERSFLDRLHIRSRKIERLWQADTAFHETIVQLLDDGGKQLLLRRESRTAVPNYFVRKDGRGGLRALTSFRDPVPLLAGIERRLVTYVRDDSLPLSGTLYLPVGYARGKRVPAIIWASQPRVFPTRKIAGQVNASPNRFLFPRGPSPYALLTQGYAVFEIRSMPLVRADSTGPAAPPPQQLVAEVTAAVKALTGLGVVDSARIALGGPGASAKMIADVLALTDLFRAGIAVSTSERSRSSVGAMAASPSPSTLDSLPSAPDSASSIADSLFAADSVAPARDSVSRRPDSLSRAPDSLSRAPDSLSPAPDSVSRAPDTLSRTPDSLALARDSAARAPDSAAVAPGSARRPPDHSEPLLFIRGAEQLSRELQAQGRTVRYVTLPAQAEPSARENMLLMVGEMIEWMERYVKNATPRQNAVGN